MPGPDDASARLVLSPEEERAYEQHDLRRAVWAYLSELRHSADFVKLAAPAASMMRVILALGDEPRVVREDLLKQPVHVLPRGVLTRR